MTLEPIQIQYGIRLRTVLFPFTVPEMLSSLEKKGYDPNPSIPRPLPIERERANVAGPIASKGRMFILVDSSSQYLGTLGESKESVLTAFRDLATQLFEDYNIRVDALQQYYTFQAVYSFRTRRKPIERIGNTFGLSKSDELSAILGEEVSLFQFRVGGTKLRVNDEDWFDIAISPNALREDAYRLEVVYRNPDKSKTDSFIDTIESKLLKIVGIMEG